MNLKENEILDEQFDRHMVEMFLEENYASKPDIDNPYLLYWKEDVIDAIIKFNELNKSN